MATFVLAGHHSKDPGAVHKSRKEKDETIRIQERLVYYLKQLGIKTIKDNPNHTLQQVINSIEPGDGSVLIDSHYNASSNPNATGIECIVNNKSFENKDNSYKMADEICKVGSEILGIKNRGVKSESQTPRKRLAILHTKSGVSVLVEWAFITNTDDMKAIDDNIEKLCKAVANILKKYDDMR